MWSTPRRRSDASHAASTYSGRPLTPRRVGFSRSRTIPNLVASTHLVAPVGDRAADELLVVAVPVRVGGVEHRHAELEGAVDGGDRLRLVGCAVELGHAHAAEPFGRADQALRAE